MSESQYKGKEPVRAALSAVIGADETVLAYGSRQTELRGDRRVLKAAYQHEAPFGLEPSYASVIKATEKQVGNLVHRQGLVAFLSFEPATSRSANAFRPPPNQSFTLAVIDAAKGGAAPNPVVVPMETIGVGRANGSITAFEPDPTNELFAMPDVDIASYTASLSRTQTPKWVGDVSISFRRERGSGVPAIEVSVDAKVDPCLAAVTKGGGWIYAATEFTNASCSEGSESWAPYADALGKDWAPKTSDVFAAIERMQRSMTKGPEYPFG